MLSKQNFECFTVQKKRKDALTINIYFLWISLNVRVHIILQKSAKNFDKVKKIKTPSMI